MKSHIVNVHLGAPNCAKGFPVTVTAETPENALYILAETIQGIWNKSNPGPQPALIQAEQDVAQALDALNMTLQRVVSALELTNTLLEAPPRWLPQVDAGGVLLVRDAYAESEETHPGKPHSDVANLPFEGDLPAPDVRGEEP